MADILHLDDYRCDDVWDAACAIGRQRGLSPSAVLREHVEALAREHGIEVNGVSPDQSR